jgi:hypothetical protein
LQVVAAMALLHPACAGLAWQVADCTDLACTPGGSYDLVLDKATLDALLSLAPGQQQGRGYRQGPRELAQVSGGWLAGGWVAGQGMHAGGGQAWWPAGVAAPSCQAATPAQ